MASLGAGLGSRTRSSVPGNNRYALRFCLLGEAGTGKSCLFYRIKNGEFRDENRDSSTERTFPTATSRTRFYDTYTLTVRPDRRTKISLTIMDTASRERFQSLTAQYYKRNNVIILVCSLDNEYFLTRLSKWFTEAQYYVDDPRVVYAIAAMKSDLPPARREVTREALLEFAEHYNIREELVFEVSAMTGEGVEEMLLTLCEAVIEQFRCESSALPLVGGAKSTERSSLLANPVTNNGSALVSVRLSQPSSRDHIQEPIDFEQDNKLCSNKCCSCHHHGQACPGCCHCCCSCTRCSSCSTCCQSNCTIL